MNNIEKFNKLRRLAKDQGIKIRKGMSYEAAKNLVLARVGNNAEQARRFFNPGQAEEVNFQVKTFNGIVRLAVENLSIAENKEEFTRKRLERFIRDNRLVQYDYFTAWHGNEQLFPGNRARSVENAYEALKGAIFKNYYAEDGFIYFFKGDNSPQKYTNLFLAQHGNCILNPIMADIMKDKNPKNKYLKAWILQMEHKILARGFDVTADVEEIKQKGFGLYIKDVMGHVIVEVPANKRGSYHYIANFDHAVFVDKQYYVNCQYKCPTRIELVKNEPGVIEHLFETTVQYFDRTVVDVTFMQHCDECGGEHPEQEPVYGSRPRKEFAYIEPIFRSLTNCKVMVGMRTPTTEYHFTETPHPCCMDLKFINDKLGVFTSFDVRLKELNEKYHLREKCPSPELYEFLRAADHHQQPVNYPGAEKFANKPANFLDLCSAYPSYKTCSMYDIWGDAYMPTFFVNVSKAQSDKYKLQILQKSGFVSITNVVYGTNTLADHARALGLGERDVYPNPLIAYLWKEDAIESFDITTTAYNNAKRNIDFGFTNCKHENCHLIGRLISGSRPVRYRGVSNECFQYFMGKIHQNGEFAGGPVPSSHDGIKYVPFETTEDPENSAYHVHSYILAYETINMLEIMKNIPADKCIRYKVDCIYTTEDFSHTVPDAISSADYEARKKAGAPLTEFFGLVKHGVERVRIARILDEPEEAEPAMAFVHRVWKAPEMNSYVFENIKSPIMNIQGMAGCGKSTFLETMLPMAVSPAVCAPTNCLAVGLTKRGISAKTTCKTFAINPFCKDEDLTLGNNRQIQDWRTKGLFVFDDVGLDSPRIIKLVIGELVSRGRQICLTFDPTQCRFKVDGVQQIEEMPFYEFADLWELKGQHRMYPALEKMAEKYRSMTAQEMQKSAHDDFNLVSMADLHKHYTDLDNDIIISPKHVTRDNINNYIFGNEKFEFNKGVMVKVRDNITTRDGSFVKGRIRTIRYDEEFRTKQGPIQIEDAMNQGKKIGKVTPMHAICIQSLQGATVEGKVFIDGRRMRDTWESSIFYTSISRAQQLCDVYIITNDKTEIRHTEREEKRRGNDPKQ